MRLFQLYDLADRFEQKIVKEAQTFSENGTTQLFFGDENKQRSFDAAVRKGAISKFLTNMAIKTQKTTSFDLKITAIPKKGASWMLQTNPPNIHGIVSKLLDDEFKKITGKGMAQQAQNADAEAKKGHGSGTLNVSSFSADMD